MNTSIYNLTKIVKFLPISLLSKITGQNAIFPFYHLVSDADVVHIKHLYPVKNVSTFEKDLDFLLKNYKPIDLSTLENYLQNNNPIQDKVFLLSFDDGLSQFYDIIAPILLRKGIPAITFLNSAFIDNKDLFFRYKQSILIEKYVSNAISLGQKSKLTTWLKSKNQTSAIISNSIRSIRYNEKEFLDEIAEILEVDFQEYLAKNQPYLNTSQIQSLIKQGFDFGAHSIDHPHYYQIPLDQQLHQTIESIKEITNAFQLDKRLFSFPFTDSGVSKAFFETIFQKDKPIADLTFGCAGMKKDITAKHIQRIPLEIANYSARDIVTGEYLYYIAKMFFNKNTITRK